MAHFIYDFPLVGLADNVELEDVSSTNGTAYKVTAEFLNVRDYPSLSRGQILSSFPKGKALYIENTVRHEHMDWGKFTGQTGKKCYVSMSNLEKE